MYSSLRVRLPLIFIGGILVAAIVAAHQGSVAVLPGAGAIFEVRIPKRTPTTVGHQWDHDRAPTG